MSPEPVKVDLLGLSLLIRGTPGKGYRARGVYRGNGAELAFEKLIVLETRVLRDLLAQIERQYADFGREVSWWSEDGMVEVRWSLDERGHLAGSMRLVDTRWRFETHLAADQSYLPRIALGLRMALEEVST